MSAPLALIDSSAWIEVLRGRAIPALRHQIETALHEGRAALAPPVWVELYAGVRGKQELAKLQSLRRLCHWLVFDDQCWENATSLARACRERGTTVPMSDVLVFACAQRYGAEVIEQDQHFGMIAKASKS